MTPLPLGGRLVGKDADTGSHATGTAKADETDPARRKIPQKSEAKKVLRIAVTVLPSALAHAI
jgi:hypothetical protein